MRHEEKQGAYTTAKHLCRMIINIPTDMLLGKVHCPVVESITWHPQRMTTIRSAAISTNNWESSAHYYFFGEIKYFATRTQVI